MPAKPSKSKEFTWKIMKKAFSIGKTSNNTFSDSKIKVAHVRYYVDSGQYTIDDDNYTIDNDDDIEDMDNLEDMSLLVEIYGGSEGRVIRESSTQGSVNQTSSSRKMQNVGQRSTASYQLVVEEDENLISSQNSKLHGQRDVYSR
ncbi:hypothetical protein M9H77_34071 [Catharanthus roseus]|uniref:Uncharacterized protein n=1 Tax=Catharanthus roseus TaxID=4058 RepID=A0ACB9ZK32_CATRO|nr:hypothetical protein M9H77_34071 [Catharanthus roseus]